MQTSRSGSCSCGAVRYLVKGDPVQFGLCHCASCRKESGSVFVAYAKWPIEDAEITGSYQTYQGRSFCPLCGSRLFNLHVSDIEIRIGSLDEAPATFGVPSREGWIQRREPWLRPVRGAHQNNADPPL